MTKPQVQAISDAKKCSFSEAKVIPSVCMCM